MLRMLRAAQAPPSLSEEGKDKDLLEVEPPSPAKSEGTEGDVECGVCLDHAVRPGLSAGQHSAARRALAVLYSWVWLLAGACTGALWRGCRGEGDASWGCGEGQAAWHMQLGGSWARAAYGCSPSAWYAACLSPPSATMAALAQVEVAFAGCEHALCLECARNLTKQDKKPPHCPFCRWVGGALGGLGGGCLRLYGRGTGGAGSPCSVVPCANRLLHPGRMLAATRGIVWQTCALSADPQPSPLLVTGCSHAGGWWWVLCASPPCCTTA